ncbi:MAG: hypothetical protein Q8O79_05415 [Pseudomonadota bacterium]|nr:hypothetical protein [Pseudomonadota bacterium]
MVTEISGAGLGHSVVGQLGATASQRVGTPLRPEFSGARAGVVTNDESQSASTQVSGVYAKLLAGQDSLGKAAAVVREVGATVEKADKLLSKMEEDLGTVVKIYPPYPIDNPERISLLNNFGGLRRQIDALTFPPPETLEELGRLLNTPEDANAKNAGNAEQVSAVSLIKEPMWDIPSLDPLAASDAAVSEAFDQVKSMRSVLEDLQVGMWKDVISFVQQADSSEVQNEASGTREQLADLAVRGEKGIGSNAGQLALAVESK